MTFDIKKFTDHIRGASTLKATERAELAAAIQAAAPSLGIADLKVLTKTLSDLVQADAAKNSRKAVRLQKLRAALENQADDPAVDSQVRKVRGELQRLGLGDINGHSATGVDLHDLDRRMKDEKWDAKRKIALKCDLSQIGLLED
jgi:hypothetical protein